MKWWHQQYVIMFCKMSSSGCPSRGFSWKLWWFCGSSVLQGWADSSEQRGAAVVWDRPCWRFKSAERATKGRHVQVQPQSAFHLMEMSCSAGTKRGTLHFVINAANCVSTFPARGQLRAVSPCEQASEVHLSLSGGATVWWTAAGRLTDKQSCSVADSSRVRGGAERRGLHRIVKWTGVIFAGMFTCRLNLQLTS